MPTRSLKVFQERFFAMSDGLWAFAVSANCVGMVLTI